MSSASATAASRRARSGSRSRRARRRRAPAPTSSPTTSRYVPPRSLDERAAGARAPSAAPARARPAGARARRRGRPSTRCAMRAARRTSRSPSSAPVSATTTRSRVSQGRSIPCSSPVLVEGLVDAVGDPEQRELAERTEVALAEVVAERGVDPLGGIDVAVRHPSAQRLGAHVDELDLVGAARDLVRDRLALRDARDPLDDVVQRLEVLDVERRDDVDAGVEQLVDVLPALLVARARDVRVRELVDERDLGPAARASRRRPSPRTREPRYSIARRGTTSRSPICSAVLLAAVGLDDPTTTSVPRSRRRRPSSSIAKVLPTPGAAPR